MINLESHNIGAQITKTINQDLISTDKKDMKVSKRYYEKKHDILDYRMFYVDSNNVVREELNRSNYKIPHPFYSELIEQKVNYLLANEIGFETENEELEGYLKQYVDADLQMTLADLVEGASLKGLEGLYYYYDWKGMIHFEVADSYNLIFLNDEYGDLAQVIRHYNVKVDRHGKQEVIQRAELFTEEGMYSFIKEKIGYVIDTNVELNPRPYKMLKIGDNLYKEKNQSLPFLVLENNKQRTTDLNGIKDLIDDYDLLASSLTNNIQDHDYPLVAVKGYEGDNLDGLINNLKTRKTVSLAQDGDLQVRTVEIPVDARKTKLDITKESIYKFGMGFDSSAESGDRALTNIGIKSRYSLLDIKVNKIETRLRKLLQQVLLLILQNIKDLTTKSFDITEIEVIITRSAMTNDKEKAEEENLIAQAQLTRVNAILNAGMQLDKTLTAELLAKELGLEVDKVTDFIQSEDYIEPLTGD